MQLVLTTTAGLVVWLVLWSIGVKAIDAFMITTLIIMVGCLAQIATKYLPSSGQK